MPIEATTLSYGERLGSEAISAAVLEYVNGVVRREIGNQAEFDLRQAPITFDLQKLHGAFLTERINITKTLGALCEVVFRYPCDMLLLTGRPSRLPGVQAFIRKVLPLPPGRILPLQNYRTGGWYPFHKSGLIDDPKSTASVGAMLCLLCANHSVPNFHFRTAALKPESTIRHLGRIDNNNVIKDADVLYRDIQSEECQMILPTVGEGEDADTPQLEMRGPQHLGFRQLSAERWAATPLYILRFTTSGKDKFARAEEQYEVQRRKGESGEAPLLRVRLKVREKPEDRKIRDRGLISDRLEIAGVESNCNGISFNARADLELEFNTMLGASLSDETKYWLDSGSVKRK